MSEELLLPTYGLGYAKEKENKEFLVASGVDSKTLLRQYQDSFPKFESVGDPTSVFDVLDQGQQGSCQGHALAAIFSICYYLATARKAAFSRACGYYVSQRFDGINSDSGSTLSGGNKVATQHGMCLEKDWPYPSRYNPRQPAGITFPFKLKVSKPFTDFDELKAWIEAGLPIQTGMDWNDSCSREIVTSHRQGGGGHSTCFWLQSKAKNVLNINSWGKGWNGDGVHEWTDNAIKQLLAGRWTTLIGYAPDEMSFPTPEPLGTYDD